MKDKDSKGQGAMEYLMSYGWAILVVMIVGVVLWKMGIFGGMECHNSARKFEVLKPLNPEEINQYPDGNLSLTLINTGASSATIEEITWNLSSSSSLNTNAFMARRLGRNAVDLSAGNVGVPSGSTVKIYASSLTGYSGSPGEAYSGTLTIRYKAVAGGYGSTQIEQGEISGCMVD